MATTSEARALPFFTDLFGAPLESGSIYIGQAGLDPVAYPAIVTSDVAGEVVLQQPVRTVHGRATAAGALVHMFCPIPYSITILDSSGRAVYTSLSETDPIFSTLNKLSVQSAADLPELRSRSGASSNLIWVTGFGMYVFVPTDVTSPESIPFVIVGNDGSRYYLNMHAANLSFAKISQPSANQVSQGLWASWNDTSDGIAYLTNNRGLGNGGFVLRTVNSDNTSEIGRVTVTSNGVLTAGSGVTTTAGDIRSAATLISNGGIVSLTSDGARTLSWDQTNQRYVFATSPVLIQNSLAVTVASLVNIINTQQIGAIILTANSTAPTQPGTWQSIALGLGSTGISQWLRTA